MNPSPAASLRLEAKGIAKHYGHLTALQAVDLCIDPGDFIVVLGRNGAGKTTLLRLLATIIHPSEGSLWFDGTPLAQCPASLKSRFGFVGHESFLYDELTVRENLLFYARLYGLADGARAVATQLEALELSARAGDLVRNLSRGLRQRVAIARALLHQPSLLLLDEPATGLDAPSRERLHDLLRRLHREGRTILFSSHDVAQGLALATRVVLLERGRIAFDGRNTPEAQAAVAAQLGSGGV